MNTIVKAWAQLPAVAQHAIEFAIGAVLLSGLDTALGQNGHYDLHAIGVGMLGSALLQARSLALDLMQSAGTPTPAPAPQPPAA